MGALQIYFVAVLIIIGAYTGLVIMEYGVNLFPYFFGDMMALTWAGQFNLDFMFMLSFSALWTMWRNQFTLSGIGLGVLAFFFGAPFLCLYMLYLAKQTNGDLVAMLIGDRTGSALA
jgi:hypothetical protein